MDPSKQPGILVHQVYLESCNFRHREDFLSLPPTSQGAMLDLVMEAQYLMSDDGDGMVMRLVVRTPPDADGSYHLEVIVGAMLGIDREEPNFTLQEYAATAPIALLFPFAREMVANLTGRGRFGPFWLHPFNFVASAATSATPRARVQESEPKKLRRQRK